MSESNNQIQELLPEQLEQSLPVLYRSIGLHHWVSGEEALRGSEDDQIEVYSKDEWHYRVLRDQANRNLFHRCIFKENILIHTEVSGNPNESSIEHSTQEISSSLED